MLQILKNLFGPFSQWETDIYALSGTLEGHNGPINALAFSNNGLLLASGGDDEQVKIWDISTFRQCQKLMNPQGRWGQITCLKFISFETPAAVDWLCFGTGRGMIGLYRKSRKAAEFTECWSMSIFPAGDSVETLAFDPIHHRLAVGSHYGQIRVLRYQSGNFTELWKDEIQDAIPRALVFTDSGRSLSIFTLETGTMICRDAETAETMVTRNIKTAIGHVSHCQLTGNFLVDNMRDGFDLYSFHRAGRVRTFRVETSRMYVKASTFCEGGKILACGSDHGRVYIFAIGEESAIQELKHGKRQDLIQVVEATTANGSYVIASGSSDGKYDIYLWKKTVKGQAPREEKGQLLETLVAMNIIILFVFLWMTRDAWSLSISKQYRSLFDLSERISFPLEARQTLPEKKDEQQGKESSVAPLVQKILYELDDESARRILKMPPAFSLEKLMKEEIETINDDETMPRREVLDDKSLFS